MTIVRWHLDGETFEPRRCDSTKPCPLLLSDAEHYDSLPEARAAAQHTERASPPPPLLQDFTRCFPARRPLEDYVSPGDYIAYNDEVMQVRTLHYERGLLAYIINQYAMDEAQIPDEHWYHDSRIMLLDRRSPVAPENFERDLPAWKLENQQRFTMMDSNEVLTMVSFEDSSTEDRVLVRVEEHVEPLSFDYSDEVLVLP